MSSNIYHRSKLFQKFMPVVMKTTKALKWGNCKSLQGGMWTLQLNFREYTCSFRQSFLLFGQSKKLSLYKNTARTKYDGYIHLHCTLSDVFKPRHESTCPRCPIETIRRPVTSDQGHIQLLNFSTCEHSLKCFPQMDSLRLLAGIISCLQILHQNQNISWILSDCLLGSSEHSSEKDKKDKKDTMLSFLMILLQLQV